MLGVYHGDPDVTPAGKLRADCGVTVDDGVAGAGEVGVQTLDGGDYAILRQRGPYSELSAAYRWLYGTWLPASGREPRHAPPFEVYLNSPQEVKAEDLLTDIHLPLAPR
jgi:AraC family transcriptional regulator